MLILEIAAGIILGKFIYQYLVDDLIQSYLRKKYRDKALKALEEMGTLTPGLSALFGKETQNKTDLH
jgi:hypothetical protein